VILVGDTEACMDHCVEWCRKMGCERGEDDCEWICYFECYYPPMIGIPRWLLEGG